METKILKVVRQGEAFSVQSAKAETGTIHKCNIVLRELGGKFENEFVCAMLGSLAACTDIFMSAATSDWKVLSALSVIS